MHNLLPCRDTETSQLRLANGGHILYRMAEQTPIWYVDVIRPNMETSPNA